MQSSSRPRTSQSRQSPSRLPSARPRSTTESNKHSSTFDSKCYNSQLPPALMPSTAHLHEIKKLPPSLQDIRGINSRDLTLGQRLYLRSIAHCYSIVSTKTRLKQGYHGLLLKQYNTGSYTQDEYRRYIEWIFGNHKRLYKVDPLIWRSPSPPRTARSQTQSSSRPVETKAQKEHPVPKLHFKQPTLLTATPNSARNNNRLRKLDDKEATKNLSSNDNSKKSIKSSTKSTPRKKAESKVVNIDFQGQSPDHEREKSSQKYINLDGDSDAENCKDLKKPPESVHEDSTLGSQNSDSHRKKSINADINPEPGSVSEDSSLGSQNSDNHRKKSINTDINPEPGSVSEDSSLGSQNSDSHRKKNINPVINPEPESVSKDSSLKSKNSSLKSENSSLKSKNSSLGSSNSSLGSSNSSLGSTNSDRHRQKNSSDGSRFNVNING